jgi:hypothetical protein
MQADCSETLTPRCLLAFMPRCISATAKSPEKAKIFLQIPLFGAKIPTSGKDFAYKYLPTV